jgi:ATP-dependent HslUV protease ATP-binding subunit HslU
MTMSELTPAQIVRELDKYIVGQDKAKRAVAIALRNRYRRDRLPDDIKQEVIPKNILMIGPTGVGKTEIARRLAKLANAPFVKVEATKFTEVGYVGRDVDSMIRELVQTAYKMEEEEQLKAVADKGRQIAIDRIVDSMQPMPKSERLRPSVESAFKAVGQLFGVPADQDSEKPPEEEPTPEQAETQRGMTEQIMRIRERLRRDVASGKLDDQTVEIEVEEGGASLLQGFTQAGMEEMVIDLRDAIGPLMPRRKARKTMTVADALKLLAAEESQRMIDRDQVARTAIERAEQSGIVFLDELDKITLKEKGAGPDVSREGVQRDLLPIIEGSTVHTKFGPADTSHILFIAAGSFHSSKPSDLIPELQGRLPIRVGLDSLGETDFVRILKEPDNALVKQYESLLKTEGVDLDFTDEGVEEIAALAALVNSQTENIGARRLHTMLERLLEDVSFSAPELSGQSVVVDRDYVRSHLADVAKSEDLSRYIL